MEIIEALRNRRSIRSFKPDPVPRKVLEELLDVCRWSPSGSNMQTWEFAILGGKVLEEVKARLARELETGWDSTHLRQLNTNPDVPEPVWPEVYMKRRLALRERIDSHQFPLGTTGLSEKRTAYHLYGGRFYGAPNAIVLYTERSICPKALLDTGLMAQTIALAALSYGLGTCLMSMPTYWPDILRELLGIPKSKLIAMSIAIGYPDTGALVNSFERSREPLAAFAHWHGV